MAILVGVVGTQVLPYIEKSRESKDLQIISSVSTAAMTAFASHAAELTESANYTITINATDYTTTHDAGAADNSTVAGEIKSLTKFADIDDITGKCVSKKANDIGTLVITYTGSTGSITVTPTAVASSTYSAAELKAAFEVKGQ
jgi:hypothetical protein